MKTLRSLSVVVSLLVGLPWSGIQGQATAATYHVAKPPTGSDTRTCAQAQSAGTPRATINKGIQCLSSGDTLLIGDGVYDEVISSIAGSPLAPFLVPNGSSRANPTTLQAVNIGGAIITVTGAIGDFYPITLQPSSFVTVKGLTVDDNWLVGGCATVDGGPIRFEDFTCKNSLSMGIDGYGTGHEFIRVHFDKIGWNPATNQTTCPAKTCYPDGGWYPDCHGFCHAYYMFGSGHLVDGGTHRFVDGYPHHWYATNSLIRNETVIGYPRGVGGTITVGGGNLVYNNTYQDLRNALFVKPSNEIVHNTMTGHNTQDFPGAGIDNAYGIFQQCPNTAASSCPEATTLKNNLVVKQFIHSWQRYIYVQGCDTCGSTGNQLVDQGVPPQVAGNMCDDPNPGCAHAAPSCFFQNPAAHDLHLCATSPANNAGVTISGFTQPDKDQVPRAAGNMDVGAYQLVAGGPPPTSTASALHFSQPLTTVPEDEVFGVSVRVVDQAGQLVSSTVTITMTIGANPGGSTLSGVTTQTAVAGIATFPDLSLNNPGVGYTLVASSPGLTSATSTPLTITPVGTPPSQGTPRVLILQH